MARVAVEDHELDLGPRFPPRRFTVTALAADGRTLKVREVATSDLDAAIDKSVATRKTARVEVQAHY